MSGMKKYLYGAALMGLAAMAYTSGPLTTGRYFTGRRNKPIKLVKPQITIDPDTLPVGQKHVEATESFRRGDDCVVITYGYSGGTYKALLKAQIKKSKEIQEWFNQLSDAEIEAEGYRIHKPE